MTIHVLMVEDDPMLAEIAQWTIPEADPTLDLRIITDPSTITDDDCRWAEVALVDWHLPNTDGGQVIDRILAVNPMVRPIMLSGARPDTHWLCLDKPVRVEVLIEAIHDV